MYIMIKTIIIKLLLIYFRVNKIKMGLLNIHKIILYFLKITSIYDIFSLLFDFWM